MTLIFLAAGCFAFFLAIREARVQRDLKRDGTRARGSVVRHDTVSSADSDARFAVIEFRDGHGIRHTFRSQSSGVKRLPVGGEVPVRYRAHEPGVARIDITGKKIANIGIPLLVGALFFGGAVSVTLDSGSHSGPSHGR